MTTTDESRVAAGYDLVYEAIPRSQTLARIWREHACGPDYPAGFEHISFITLDELRTFIRELRLAPGSRLVDLACGMGGPGLWIAREAEAELIGVDHVLFGSDYPHPEGLAEPASYVDELAGLPEESIRKIMGGNLARLMNVEDAVVR